MTQDEDVIEPMTCGIDEAVDKHLGKDADAFYELIIKGLEMGIDEGVPGGDRTVASGKLLPSDTINAPDEWQRFYKEQQAINEANNGG